MVRPPKVAVSGTFHRDPEGLANLVLQLQRIGCQVLSPRSEYAVSADKNFVRFAGEESFDPTQIERWHLHAILHADALWLHCPAGYIGIATAMEIGFAVALNKPVFTLRRPNDEQIAGFVETLPDVFAMELKPD